MRSEHLIIVESNKIQGLKLLYFKPHTDSRGAFVRMYCKEEFGKDFELAQINYSFSPKMGTLRGLHFQPGQQKIVRCISGEVQDVIVDLRSTSSTFGNIFYTVLSTIMLGVWIPSGCAHGFLTLTDNCSVMYMSSRVYNPHTESGVRWDDLDLKIPWMLQPKLVSDRDQELPLWKDFQLVSF